CRKTTTAFGVPFARTVQYSSLPTPWSSKDARHCAPQPASAMRTSALVVQIDQRRAARDTITFPDVDGADGRVERGEQRRLHLHGLQYDERVVRLDCCARVNVDLDHSAGHRRRDCARGLARP